MAGAVDISPNRARHLANCADGDPGVEIRPPQGVRGHELHYRLQLAQSVERKPLRNINADQLFFETYDEACRAFLRAAFQWGTAKEVLQAIADEMMRLRGAK